MSVSIVIPNWNGAAMLSKTLDCLALQKRRADQVIVVDNGSRDESAEIAAAGGARVIRFKENLGFSRAVNAGIEAASGDWIAVLNNDVELQEDWLEVLLHRASARDAWFASGKLICASQPAILDGTWDALCRGACAWRCGAARADGPAWNVERTIRFVPFTAALFRADLFRRVGLLDDAFESYLEDIDFGLRCAMRGYSGIYVPGAVAKHQGSATLGRWHPDTIRRIARNQVLLVARHFPRNWIFRYGWPVFVGQLLWGLIATRHGGGGAYLRGKWEGVRQFRAMHANSAGPHETLSAILRESENEIRELQRQTGYDLFWRLYFALT